MIEVVGITFGESNQIFYFSPEKLKLKENITVIVETERGLQFGKVKKTTCLMKEKNITVPLYKIVRIANKQDYLKHKKNLKDASLALEKCRELVIKKDLSMQIIDCNFTFDRNQLIFRFLADTRIDFRELARELASIYKTRIELRQVGVRDKAKEIGGIGPCGRTLCCASFLKDFNSVSINMAKNQNLSLNQTKINGSCGRLLCCLKFEDDTYTNSKDCLPKIGSIIETENGLGKVIDIDVLNQKYCVEIKDAGIIEMSVSCEKN